MIEIEVQADADGNVGTAYIVTGAAVSTPTGWRFMERLREPLVYLPAKFH